MWLILWVLVGAAAGWFATRVMDINATPLQTVLIGMAGALVGGLIVQAVLAVLGALAGIIGAVAGAMLVLWLWDRYAR